MVVYNINIMFMLMSFPQVLSRITSHCGHPVEDKTKIRQVQRELLSLFSSVSIFFFSSRYRRRQRLYVEMEQMASRPFGQVLVELERFPDTSSESSHHSRSVLLPDFLWLFRAFFVPGTLHLIIIKEKLMR